VTLSSQPSLLATPNVAAGVTTATFPRACMQVAAVCATRLCTLLTPTADRGRQKPSRSIPPLPTRPPPASFHTFKPHRRSPARPRTRRFVRIGATAVLPLEDLPVSSYGRAK